MGIQENIAAILRGLKMQNKKSMTEFAEELEISRSMLQEYLSGKGNPRISTIEHLAKKLGIAPSHLLSVSFSTAQLEVLSLLFSATNALATLKPKDQERFLTLLQEILSLWKPNTGADA